MSAAPSYFPYHPLRWRLTLLGGALIAAGLATWAALSWYRGGGPLEVARMVLSATLLCAIISIAIRLRPRSGWGIRIGPSVLTVARTLQGQVDIPWSAVREIRRVGRWRTTLVVTLSDERQVQVPRYLFSRRRDFEALIDAIENAMPTTPYDA